MNSDNFLKALDNVFKTIATLSMEDKKGNKFKIKQIYIKHYKNIKRAEEFLLKNSLDEHKILIEKLKEIRRKKITWFFALDSYYDGSEYIYLKVYIIKIGDDKEIKK